MVQMANNEGYASKREAMRAEVRARVAAGEQPKGWTAGAALDALNGTTAPSGGRAVDAQKAELVGNDELGLGASLDGFEPTGNSVVDKIFLKQTRKGAEAKVDKSYVQLSPDDYVVAVRMAHLEDTVFLLWVAEGELAEFDNDEGEHITFRRKTLTGVKRVGVGDAGEEEALAAVREIRTGLEYSVMRQYGGLGRDVGEALDAEDEADFDAQAALERLMSE